MKKQVDDSPVTPVRSVAPDGVKNKKSATASKNPSNDMPKQINFELAARNEELRQSEERYHRMIAEIQDYAIILLSKEGVIENWNKGAEKIKGYTAEEIVGRNFRIFYSPEDQERHLPEKLIREAVNAGRAVHEGWRIRKDGSRFWGSIVITALHDEQNNVVGFSKVTRDLTDKKLTEDVAKSNAEKLEQANKVLAARNEELRKSEERYHRMISEVQDYAIILLTKEGLIENWNKGAEKIKGYAATEIVGQHFRVFYSKEDQQNRLPEQLLQVAYSKGRAAHEGWRTRKDGSRFWGGIVITALHDESNNIIGFSKVTRDFTDKKNLDDQLKANAAELEQKNKRLEQMNQELTSFAYVSSHDLQEPLRKIQTFSTRIIEMEEINLSEKGADYFNRIQNAASRMQALIDDLLAYSRTNTDERQPENTDLNTLLAEVKADLREKIEEKHAAIKSTPLPTLDIVPFQFRQLFNNLIGNSIKFSKEGVPPEIKITAAIVPGEDIETLDPGKKYHHIAVADNGIGFEAEYRDKIFEVFQRLHGRSEYSGTGIGLAICKKIIDNHNGIITAEGELDKGSTFHIYLPVEPS